MDRGTRIRATFKKLTKDKFSITSQGGLSWLQAPRLDRYSWLAHAFSTRQGGVSQAPCAGLNLGLTDADRPERVEQNRRLFLAQFAGENLIPCSVRQIHSSQTFVVGRDQSGQLAYRLPGSREFLAPSVNPPPGDALITAEPGILLTIRIADCLPILLADSQRRVVAAVHAGWRGALARIVEKAVGDMRRAFHTEPQGLFAAMGPSIRSCCYDVGEEVVEAFHGKFTGAERFFQTLPHRPELLADRHSMLFLRAYPPGHAPQRLPAARLDLVAVARDQLLSAGVKPANIVVADYCTACRTDLFFSHRREGGVTGRQVAAIGIR